VTRLADLDEPTRQAAEQFAAAVRASGQFDVAGIAVYGSRARGDHERHSDADIAVIVRAPVKPRYLLSYDLIDHAVRVMLNTGIDVSPFAIEAQHWDNPSSFSNPVLLRHIRRDGVWL
jgi:uncharacterized protein